VHQGSADIIDDRFIDTWYYVQYLVVRQVLLPSTIIFFDFFIGLSILSSYYYLASAEN